MVVVVVEVAVNCVVVVDGVVSVVNFVILCGI